MKEYLHLFEDLNNSLPELGKKVILAYEDKGGNVYFDNAKRDTFGATIYWRIDQSNCVIDPKPTHWLDLSKLTTKDKAERQLQLLFDNQDISTWDESIEEVVIKFKENL